MKYIHKSSETWMTVEAHRVVFNYTDGTVLVNADPKTRAAIYKEIEEGIWRPAIRRVLLEAIGLKWVELDDVDKTAIAYWEDGQKAPASYDWKYYDDKVAKGEMKLMQDVIRIIPATAKGNRLKYVELNRQTQKAYEIRTDGKTVLLPNAPGDPEYDWYEEQLKLGKWIELREAKILGDTVIDSLKPEREAQWGSDSNARPKGWANWRSTTFMEMIRAKWDRALQAQDGIRKIDLQIESVGQTIRHLRKELNQGNEKLDLELKTLQEARARLLFDGEDSIKDAINYSRKFKEECDADKEFYSNGGLR